MNGRRDVLPIIIASGIALVVTGVVKFLMPEKNVVPSQEKKSTQELSLPNIPLMVKDEQEKQKQKQENQVVVTAKDIKKDEKILLDSITWKKWPQDAMQPYFIAKDVSGKPLNNKADYDNALKMWAVADIPAGVPLTIRMLVGENPKKKVALDKQMGKSQKKKIVEKKDFSIRKGMRAITFSIDQRSASSSDMLRPGDLVDVLIIEQQRDDKSKIYKYKALKILAIDGMVASQKKESEKDESTMLAGLNSVSGLLFPKNVTLEIREDTVEEMLRRAGNNGVILSLRSQTEKARESDEQLVEQEMDERNLTSLMRNMSAIGGGSNSATALVESQKQKESEERSLSMIMKNMSSVGSSSAVLIKSEAEKSERVSKGARGGKYEIVSGKVVEDNDKPEKQSAIIYRKLKADEVKFDEDGRKTESSSGGGAGSQSK
ncbi:MAG: SAF domain-containing protein [Holosporaceae bacterium]|jgi:Flp pilus assembly protein CpaB|nr:SAF domain-containing protein [Holosporaceae bacterium]